LGDFVLVGDKILNNLDEKILKAIKALSLTSFEMPEFNPPQGMDWRSGSSAS
jgi:hypothetical protein